MKARSFLVVIVVISFLQVAFAGNPVPGPPVNLLFFTPNPYLGVRTGDRIDFYQFQTETGWDTVYYYIDLPVKSEEVFMTPGGLLGSRNGNMLDFYYIGWFGLLEPVDSLRFEIPCETDEVIMSGGGDLGIRCGKELKFYYYDKGWKNNENFNYTFPEDSVSELIISSANYLGVRSGNVLKFYDIANKYAPLDIGYFSFDKEVDELVITGANELGVRCGEEVIFYEYKEKWEPIPVLQYNIKKP